ncbi:MAG: hypothetical protein BA861_02805 [Desulfobacterales bacterium S3730MH5]|nr:MAG: hypothetical protein BA861_02805 [Desulfobacterales bacterium S3730MH5]
MARHPEPSTNISNNTGTSLLVTQKPDPSGRIDLARLRLSQIVKQARPFQQDLTVCLFQICVDLPGKLRPNHGVAFQYSFYLVVGIHSVFKYIPSMLLVLEAAPTRFEFRDNLSEKSHFRHLL